MFGLKLENNSGTRFNVTQVDAFDSSSIVSVDERDFDSSIPANGFGNVDIEVTSNSVSSNQTVLGFVKISGNFSDGRNCSFSDIGTQSFSIRVLNDGGTSACSSIDLVLTNVSVDEDSSETFDFSIRNPTDTTFIVDDIELVESSAYFNVVEEFHDSFINEFSEGDLRIRVNAFPISGDKSGSVQVRVHGRFSAGDSCSPTEVGVESFTVSVQEVSNNTTCSDIRINTRNVSVNENSTDFETFTISNLNPTRFILTDVQAVSNNSSVVGIGVDDFEQTVDEGNPANVELRFNSNEVSSTRSSTAYLKAEGYFTNGVNCSFGSISQPTFTITVRNEDGSPSCSLIDVQPHTIRVNEGEEEFGSFTVQNRSNRNFIIDNVTVSDTDTAFISSAYQWDDRVNANSSGSITARIKAGDVSREETGTALIQVRGHYTDGSTCSSSQIGTTSFTVIVENNGVTSSSCNDFSLTAPSFEKVSGRKTLTITVNNPLDKTGEVNLSGNNLSISPSSFNIPANSYFTKQIDVELLDGTRSFLVYDVDLPNCNILSKTTEIVSTELNEQVEIVSYPQVKTINERGTIPVTIRNNSGSQLQVEVFLEALPSSISSSKETINIPSGSSRTAQINVSGNIEGDYPAKLIVEVDNARQERDLTIRVSDSRIEETPAEEPSPAPFGTAFALLGNSWVNLILIIIIVALIYALWKRGKSQ